MNLKVLIRTIFAIFFINHCAYGMNAVLSQPKESRRSQRCRYLSNIQMPHSLEMVQEIKTAWKGHQTARFLKCSDYATDLELSEMSNAEQREYNTPTIVVKDQLDYVGDIPYYQPCFYLFARCSIKLLPNIGGIIVLIPIGDPDPAMISALLR